MQRPAKTTQKYAIDYFIGPEITEFFNQSMNSM